MIKYFLTIQLLLAFSLVDCSQQPKTYGNSTNLHILDAITVPAPWQRKELRTRPEVKEPQAKRRTLKQEVVVTPDLKEVNKRCDVTGITLAEERTNAISPIKQPTRRRTKKAPSYTYVEPTPEIEQSPMTENTPITFSSVLNPLQVQAIQQQHTQSGYDTREGYNNFLQAFTTKEKNAALIRYRASYVPPYRRYSGEARFLHYNNPQAFSQKYGTPLKYPTETEHPSE